MTTEKRTRNWMKITTGFRPVSSPISFRNVKPGDAKFLGNLMERAYQGTIDYEGETSEQCVHEMSGTLTGKYGVFFDFASFGIFDSDRALSASLVTFWKGKPLLAFSMTDPLEQRRGYAGFLIERSISALAEHGYPDFYLVVTQGNDSAERLYRRLGFAFLGPALPKQPTP